MRFSFVPQEMRFFDMFDEATVVISRAAGKFSEMVAKFDNLAERARDLKEEEVICDAVVERILKALSLTFITPIDREDVHTLATRLDNIMDNLEETAHRIAVFQIARPTAETVQLTKCIVDCCGHVEQAVHLVRNLKNHEKILKHLSEIRRLENEADNIYRNGDAAFFAKRDGPVDVLMIIKLREIYSWLEETVDACKDVAHVISEIVIKGS